MTGLWRPGRVALLASAVFSLLIAHTWAQAASPYYAYHPSDQGADFKRFEHKLSGFSIDIPASWIFGLVGYPPLGVVVVYPEGMNTAVLSPAYEMVEIGRIPVDGLPLRRAQEIVLSRMRMKHQGLRVIDEPVNLRVGKNEALRWSYAWPSKTGLTIYERNTLIAYEGSVRTVTARTARSDYKSYLEFYDRIVMTFRPNEPAK